MSLPDTTNPEWKQMQTEETNHVESVLRKHFEQVDAYRYNSASIRIRIIDSRFKRLTRGKRYDIVEPVLEELDENTQADIMNIVLLYPGETSGSFLASMSNAEFENPLDSDF